MSVCLLVREREKKVSDGEKESEREGRSEEQRGLRGCSELRGRRAGGRSRLAGQFVSAPAPPLPP